MSDLFSITSACPTPCSQGCIFWLLTIERNRVWQQRATSRPPGRSKVIRFVLRTGRQLDARLPHDPNNAALSRQNPKDLQPKRKRSLKFHTAVKRKRLCARVSQGSPKRQTRTPVWCTRTTERDPNMRKTSALNELQKLTARRLVTTAVRKVPPGDPPRI